MSNVFKRFLTKIGPFPLIVGVAVFLSHKLGRDRALSV